MKSRSLGFTCPSGASARLRRDLGLIFSAALAIAALALALAAPARAQGDAMTEMARERFQEGVKYYDAKQYDKARAAFLQAYALKKHPAVLLNLAQSELRSGHEEAAARHFALFMRENPAATALEKQEAEKGLSAAKAKVGEFEVRVDADGADVFVDNQPEGRSPLPGPVYLAPGSHSIEARKAGKVATTSVNASAGQSSVATLSLGGGAAAVAPVPAPTPDGSEPPAETPPPGAEQPPGGEPEPSGVQFDSKKRESPLAWAKRKKNLPFVTAGIGGAGIAGGVVFALVSGSKFDNANSIRDQILLEAATNPDYLTSSPCAENPDGHYTAACQKYEDSKDGAEGMKTLSIVAFVLGGAALAGTTVWYVVDSKKIAPEQPPSGRAPTRRAAVAPLVAPNLAGVVVTGEL
jgi:hypothetical protein